MIRLVNTPHLQVAASPPGDPHDQAEVGHGEVQPGHLTAGRSQAS